ncbi:hypothetical protein [Qipengyuania atrilutea]|uniref:Uncharacterized protein n=1 Tax=Qipengyuania atrilutea TaxID=2744473 RepID=A0A850GYN1_9SPHN|nr:hypothetical protein [Actirhodobacter atriluteus]NVD43477.1 hypothetical protein [Actirhodobacter atriluteus]
MLLCDTIEEADVGKGNLETIRDNADKASDLMQVVDRELSMIQIEAQSAQVEILRRPKTNSFATSDEYIRRDWNHSFSNYEAAADEDRMPCFRTLLRTRVPDLDQLRIKVEELREVYGEVSALPAAEIFTQLLADIDRLN